MEQVPAVPKSGDGKAPQVRPLAAAVCLLDANLRVVWQRTADGEEPSTPSEDAIAAVLSNDAVQERLGAVLRGDATGAEFEFAGQGDTARGALWRAHGLQVDGRRYALLVRREFGPGRDLDTLPRDAAAPYRQIFAASQDAAFALTLDDGDAGRILDANVAASRMHGYTRDELIGMHIGELDVPADAVLVPERLAELRRRGMIRFATRHRHRSGAEFPVEVTAAVVRLADRTVVLSYNRDVSEQDRVQQELAAQSVRLELAARSSEIGFWDWVVATGETYYSEEWKAQLGYAPDEVGNRFEEWRRLCHPDDVEPTLALVQKHFESDGSVPYETEFRMLHKSGQYRWILARGRAVRDAAGRPLRLVGCHVDITARRLAEEERLTMMARIEQVQRLESIGTLAGGIAHDFNNILTVITGNVDLAEMSVGDPAAHREALADVRKAAARARSLVRQILAFSRNDQPERRVVAVRDLLQETHRLLRATVPQSVSLGCEVGEDDAALCVDVEQVQQVLVNLGTNAWHAIGDRPGRVMLYADVLELPASELSASELPAVDLPPGRYVRLRVTDTGCGMDGATMRRIFEPFFTTKGVNGGTGLGLSVVHGITKRHGGAVTVRSEVGRGSEFSVWLPATEGGVVPASAPRATVSAAADKTRVLLVEDDPALLRVLRRGLELLGFEVGGYPDPLVAIAALEQDPNAWDVLVTDYDMPGLRGMDMVERARARRPALPVVLSSGFVKPEMSDAIERYGRGRVMQKPFVARELAGVLRELLDGTE
ncbi:MAG: Wide host range VirA protein [Planctomycetota bacterium]|jgi:PAS domain S-box-containing protein